MLHRKPLRQTIFAFTCLALFAWTSPLSARTPEPTSSLPQSSARTSVSGTVGDTHGNLYQKLCALNANWRNHTPNFAILTDVDLVDDEVVLIQTHLKLVLDQLGSADVACLSATQLAQRSAHLLSLQTYMEEGNFPQNVFVAGRRPVFIDPWGTHCAVGYLMATSGHSSLANRVNREHQLDWIRDIKTDGLAEWQQASGLRLDELALIQPTYRSTTLHYPKEIEELIVGNSGALLAGLESGQLTVDTRCGGRTLLHFAAAAGDLQLVKLLVEKGADLHAVSALGCEKSELTKGGSHKAVNVRWNQSTSVTAQAGRGIGVYGTVFQSKHGRLVANVLNDLHGGQAGWNALHYATAVLRHWGYYGRANITPIRNKFGKQAASDDAPPEDETITTLKKNRAAVAAWLEEQGLTRN